MLPATADILYVVDVRASLHPYAIQESVATHVLVAGDAPSDMLVAVCLSAHVPAGFGG